ncbi:MULTISPECIES: type II toxin-antitoxin system Phd/YefM family antitoxin [Pseudomonas]|uniref:Antitoxin n=1 Tax=Pseudomonas fluorescens TaxID=294 RepID=A0A161GMC1_PSEFL|nr:MULTISPECIES: type II toxin-antitoxin system Phd/YefM family antitoxin [Pseudomonas]AMZ75142.1 antitoxin [Pseudomonas fluorescens]SCZ38133.1 antitoxin StbD [Pseudomonas sp. NFACC44-2]SDA88705.1 antitoxin StbD [Pseudomonas sp. NFACC51]SEJ99511.1 antitoxin StbD [Pseudomonas sp. NFACC07-1]SFI03058.1 antitoxin StbD [Pseudomonas sp. NFACC54]
MQIILADVAVSVSELKKNPSSVLSGANGAPVAVLNHNRVMGYMVPASVYEAMVDRLEELELAQVVKARIEANETPVRMSLDELIGEAEADIVNGR